MAFAAIGILAGMTTPNQRSTKILLYQKALRRRLVFYFLAGALTLSAAPAIMRAEESADEQALWKLEHDYWHYVQENDLAAYSTLWHERFLGWPSVSPVPVHKDHITDWITSQTSKGLKFDSDHIFIFHLDDNNKIDHVRIQWNHEDFKRQLGA